MTYTIRPYEETDLDAVLSCWESASEIGHPFLDESFLDQEREDIANLYLPNADTWVAEVDGKIVGFISLVKNEVGGIFVDAAFHGQGIGQALMNKARSLHGTLELEVFEANAVGRKFYAAYGFELMLEKIHEETGHKLLRLKFTG